MLDDEEIIKYLKILKSLQNSYSQMLYYKIGYILVNHFSFLINYENLIAPLKLCKPSLQKFYDFLKLFNIFINFLNL